MIKVGDICILDQTNKKGFDNTEELILVRVIQRVGLCNYIVLGLKPNPESGELNYIPYEMTVSSQYLTKLVDTNIVIRNSIDSPIINTYDREAMKNIIVAYEKELPIEKKDIDRLKMILLKSTAYSNVFRLEEGEENV